MEEKTPPSIDTVNFKSPKKRHNLIKYIGMGILLLLPFVGFSLGVLYSKYTQPSPVLNGMPGLALPRCTTSNLWLESSSAVASQQAILNESKIILPATYKFVRKPFIAKDWAPNGYCDSSKESSDSACMVLFIDTSSSMFKKTNFAISSPSQFGYLISDGYGCSKEVAKQVEIGKSSFDLTEYYSNEKSIQYNPELIDKGQNPYDCSNVQTVEENFQFVSGCSSDGLCIWSDNTFGREKFYNLIQEIDIVKED